jgi:K319L-like, PKD domain
MKNFIVVDHFFAREWVIIRNANDTVVLDNSSSPTPRFELGLPPVESGDNTHNDTLTFELTVDDGHGNKDTNVTHVTLIPAHCKEGEVVENNMCQTQNTPPTANAGPNQRIKESLTGFITPFVQLNGTASSDPDGDNLSFSWKQIGGNNQVTLDNPNSPTPSFVSPSLPIVDASDNTTNDTLTFELTVDDGHGNKDTSDTNVTVIPIHEPPTTNITSAVDGAGNSVVNGGSIGGIVAGSSSITFTFTGNSTISIDHFECSLDSNNFSPCTSPITFNLPIGNHMFEVRAVDAKDDPDTHPAFFSWTVSRPVIQ